MKVLVAHNAYQHSGGEDAVFHNETELLRSVGHEIKEFRDGNHRIAEMNSVSLGAQTIWSESSRRKLRAALDGFCPNIVQFHNFFPLISPTAYYACHETGIPGVQTDVKGGVAKRFALEASDCACHISVRQIRITVAEDEVSRGRCCHRQVRRSDTVTPPQD